LNLTNTKELRTIIRNSKFTTLRKRHLESTPRKVIRQHPPMPPKKSVINNKRLDSIKRKLILWLSVKVKSSIKKNQKISSK